MTIVELNDYSAQYNTAYLEDPMSSATLKAKTTLLVFTVLLLVICTLGLHIKEIPGLSIEDPEASPEIAQGMLSLATGYLLLQFVVCFLQDYFRWRLKKARKTVEQFGKLLRHTSDAVDQVLKSQKGSNGNAGIANGFEHLARHLSHANDEVQVIAFSSRVLAPVHWLRFWILDLAIPIGLALIAIALSWGSAWFVTVSIARAVVS